MFFPYLDNYLRFLPVASAPEALLGRPWSGLYFRNHHLGWQPTGLKTTLKHLAKGDRILRSRSALPLVGVLDERFNSELAAQYGRTALPFPDITDDTPTTSAAVLAETLRIEAQGRPIVGLAGHVDKRKGLLTFLRVAEANEGREPLFFAVIGHFATRTFSAKELAWIEQIRLRLTGSLHLDLSSSWLSDGDYNAAFQTFDIAWAAYEDFQGSSNTLSKAARYGIPVLATEGELVSARVQDFNLGVSIPTGDVEAAYSAIRHLLVERDKGRVLRRFADYRRFHSQQQLDETFRRLIASVPRQSRLTRP